jgi:hypothetical protein
VCEDYRKYWYVAREENFSFSWRREGGDVCFSNYYIDPRKFHKYGRNTTNPINAKF